LTDPSCQPRRRLAVVAEAFVDRTLSELLDCLADAAPQVTALELGSGGYAPHPHCDREALLGDDAARARWLDGIEGAGFTIAALNAWGNPLHPDPGIAGPHDHALRQTIRLAAQLGVDRVVALAGCPAAAPGDTTPHFAAGGWLPYLEGVYERQWERSVAPYWTALGEFARAEHPEVKICLELHPGTSVYNVETFRRLAELGENLAANIDPSHFFWMQMDALAVMSELSDRVGHVHAKDVWFNERVLATTGLLDHRWPGPTADVAWKFATVGRGHDAQWWNAFMALIEGTAATAVAIEHEDPDVPPVQGVAEAAHILAGALEPAT
jgi:sugar phosphate isomerase/epimerase